jgi:hypothetical protein
MFSSYHWKPTRIKLNRIPSHTQPSLQAHNNIDLDKEEFFILEEWIVLAFIN